MAWELVLLLAAKLLVVVFVFDPQDLPEVDLLVLDFADFDCCYYCPFLFNY